MPKKERVKSLKNSNVKKRFDEENKKWRRLCSKNSCNKYSRKDGLCAHHLTENRNRQQTTTSLEVSHPTSVLSTTEECMETTDNNPTEPVALEENHTEYIYEYGEFLFHKLNVFEGVFIFEYIILENSQRTAIQTRSTSQNAVLHSASNQSVPLRNIVCTDQMNTCHSSITISTETEDNQNKPMNTTTCKYRTPLDDSFWCRKSGTYTCSHCRTLYCLEHGNQHQKDLKKEIEHLLNEAKVSYVHIVREAP
jgi:hypothetical protein